MPLSRDICQNAGGVPKRALTDWSWPRSRTAGSPSAASSIDSTSGGNGSELFDDRRASDTGSKAVEQRSIRLWEACERAIIYGLYVRDCDGWDCQPVIANSPHEEHVQRKAFACLHVTTNAANRHGMTISWKWGSSTQSYRWLVPSCLLC